MHRAGSLRKIINSEDVVLDSLYVYREAPYSEQVKNQENFAVFLEASAFVLFFQQSQIGAITIIILTLALTVSENTYFD